MDLQADHLKMKLMDSLAEAFTNLIDTGTAVQEQADCFICGVNSIDNRISGITTQLDGLYTAVIKAQEQGRLTTSITEKPACHPKSPNCVPPYDTCSLPPPSTPSNPNTYAAQA
jgi:hypothetical protein